MADFKHLDALLDEFVKGPLPGCGVRTLIDKYKGGHNGSLGAFGWTGGFGTWCESETRHTDAWNNMNMIFI